MKRPIDSYALQAFVALAQFGTYTLTAKKLGITQPALSQRISLLEKALQITLLQRGKKGVSLTSAGQELLRYAKTKETLEQEFLSNLTSNEHELKGIIRIAGYSSITRSVVLPSLSPLLAENPTLGVELFSKEFSEIPSLLLRNETDFVLLGKEIQRENIQSQLLGHEEYVLTEAKNHRKIPDIFLDHDENDEFTLQYLKKFEPQRKHIQRRYLDDVFGLIDGVAQGWGRALIPRHLIKSDNRIRVLQTQKSLRTPVYLQWIRQEFYSKLHEKIRENIQHEAKRILPQ